MLEALLASDLPTRYPLVYQLVAVVALLALAWLFHLLLRRVIVALIDRFISATSVSWDDALQQARVFDRFAVLVPIVVIWYARREWCAGRGERHL